MPKTTVRRMLEVLEDLAAKDFDAEALDMFQTAECMLMHLVGCTPDAEGDYIVTDGMARLSDPDAARWRAVRDIVFRKVVVHMDTPTS